jgi:hypothetical protein
MTKEEILAMDRTDLILSVQGHIIDPYINASDLENKQLRELLLEMYHIDYKKGELC